MTAQHLAVPQGRLLEELATAQTEDIECLICYRRIRLDIVRRYSGKK
jgi:hypothetical protein